MLEKIVFMIRRHIKKKCEVLSTFILGVEAKMVLISDLLTELRTDDNDYRNSGLEKHLINKIFCLHIFQKIASCLNLIRIFISLNCLDIEDRVIWPQKTLSI